MTPSNWCPYILKITLFFSFDICYKDILSDTKTRIVLLIYPLFLCLNIVFWIVYSAYQISDNKQAHLSKTLKLSLTMFDRKLYFNQYLSPQMIQTFKCMVCLTAPLTMFFFADDVAQQNHWILSNFLASGFFVSLLHQTCEYKRMYVCSLVSKFICYSLSRFSAKSRTRKSIVMLYTDIISSLDKGEGFSILWINADLIARRGETKQCVLSYPSNQPLYTPLVILVLLY